MVVINKAFGVVASQLPKEWKMKASQIPTYFAERKAPVPDELHQKLATQGDEVVNIHSLRNMLGVDPNAMSTRQFEQVGESFVTDPLAEAAHTSRGRTGYMAGVDEGVPKAEYIALNKELRDLDAKPSNAKTLDDANHEEALADYLSESIGPATMEKYLKGSEIPIQQPLYVTRTTGEADVRGVGNSSVSAQVVDPLNVFSRHGGDTDTKVYKLPAGTVIKHPKGVADQHEVVLSGKDLLEVPQEDIVKYRNAVNSGKAPFAVAGTAIVATTQSEESQAVWQDNLDQDFLNANAGGMSVENINKALMMKGATNENVSDYLTNTLGHDPDKAKNVVNHIMTAKVKELEKQGATEDQIMTDMLQRGYKADDIESFMTPQDSTEYMKNLLSNTTESLLSGIDAIAGHVVPFYDSANEKQSAAIAAKANAANETVEGIASNLMAPFNRNMAIRAKTESQALNTKILEALTTAGVDANIREDGAIMVPDSNGNPSVLDVGTMDILLGHKMEILSAITGGMVGAKVPGPWPAKAAGSVVGGAVGAGLGRGGDMLRNWVYLKQEIDSKFLLDQMIKTGAADAVFGVVIPAGIKVASGTIKGIHRAYDQFFGGNLAGANKSLLEFLHLTAEEADTIIKDWEQLTQQKAPGLTRAAKNIAILPRTASGGSAVIGPAAKESSAMSVNIAHEVSLRAKDLQGQIAGSTSETVGHILRNELPQHERRVKDTYEAVKQYGISQMGDTGYKFNYDKMVDTPLLERMLDNIHNDTTRKQAESLLAKVKSLGNKTVTTETIVPGTKKVMKDKIHFARKGGRVDRQVETTVPTKVKQIDTEVVETQRSFEDLIELRKLINEFGSKKNIKNAKDIEMIANIRHNIDKELRTAARTHMGKSEGAAWSKEWDTVNVGYKNWLDLQKNTLVKSIMSKGVTDKQIAAKLMKSAMSVDNTYREVMQALPTKMRAPTENAVMREVVDKFTIGKDAGQQAIDFVALNNTLDHIPFTTESAKQLKRGIAEFSHVFKNDPAILQATGTVKTPSFQSYLTVDPVIRAKYEVASSVFNYIKRVMPGSKAKDIALVMATAKMLANPKNAASVEAVIKQLPPDPALRNALRTKALEIAKWNEKSIYPEVSAYRGAPRGHTKTKTDGPLGTGIYLNVDKTAARTKAKQVRGNISEMKLHPDRIADESMIREVLQLDNTVEITPKLIKANERKLKQLLEARMQNGIIIGDNIMLF